MCVRAIFGRGSFASFVTLVDLTLKVLESQLGCQVLSHCIELSFLFRCGRVLIADARRIIVMIGWQVERFGGLQDDLVLKVLITSWPGMQHRRTQLLLDQLLDQAGLVRV